MRIAELPDGEADGTNHKEQNTTTQLTLEQKIGQILCLGFDGTELNAELRVLVAELQVGGLVYFERNVASRTALAQLSADVQALAQAHGLPGLLLAIDQEGGRVTGCGRPRASPSFPAPAPWRPAAGRRPCAPSAR